MNLVTFRNASQKDAQSIAKLHAESWRLNYRGLLDDQFLDDEVIENRKQVWSERMNSPDLNQRVILAEVQDELIGFGCLFLNDDTQYGALLDNLHVAKSYSGKGIGSGIIKRLASEIYNAGERKDMYLWVLKGNDGAIRLYKKLGAQQKELEVETEFGNRPVEKYRYYWPNVDILIKDT